MPFATGLLCMRLLCGRLFYTLYHRIPVRSVRETVLSPLPWDPCACVLCAGDCSIPSHLFQSLFRTQLESHHHPSTLSQACHEYHVVS